MCAENLDRTEQDGAQKKDEERDRLRTTVSMLALFVFGLLLIIASLLVPPSYPLLGTILRDIGFVFSPIAAMALLYHQLAEKPRQIELENRMANRISEEIEKQFQQMKNPKERFVCFENRAAIDLVTYFQKAQSQIDILVTNLQSLQMHYGIFLAMASKGVRVRILTLNPAHEFLKKRFNELDFKKANHFREEMVSSLRSLWTLRSTKLDTLAQENLQIRLYEHTPTLMVFRRDEDVIISHILRQGRAREHLHILFDAENERNDTPATAMCFVEHFEALFDESGHVVFDDEGELVMARDPVVPATSQTSTRK